MDIQYLLWLQSIREALPAAVTKLFLIITDAGAGTLSLFVMALVFWCTDKKKSRIVIFSYGMGFVFNQILKHIFCIYRPWIRSTQIHPEQSAIPGGYSFPSGHSQFAASEYGTLAWLYRRKKVLSICCFALMILVAFSRNFLGYHTPQDVLVGLAVGIGTTVLVIRFFDWSDQKEGRELMAVAVSVVVILALLAFEELRPYPMDYVDGKLLVDPEEMKLGCYSAAASQITLMFGWLIEKKWIHFNSEGKMGSRVLRFVIGIIGFILFAKLLVVKLVALCVPKVGAMVQLGLITLYISVLYPWLVSLWQHVRKSGR